MTVLMLEHQTDTVKWRMWNSIFDTNITNINDGECQEYVWYKYLEWIINDFEYPSPINVSFDEEVRTLDRYSWECEENV